MNMSNITIKSIEFNNIVNSLPQEKILNSEFILSVCKTLDGSITNALLIIWVGFILTTIFSYCLTFIDWNKISEEVDHKIAKDFIKEFPEFIEKLGDILIFVGVLYLTIVYYIS